MKRLSLFTKVSVPTLFIGVIVAVAVFIGTQHEAHSGVPPVEILHQIPGLQGPIATNLDSFTVACDSNDGGVDVIEDTVNKINFETLYCENPNTRPVYIGGAFDVGGAGHVTENNGAAICNSSACLKSSWSGNVMRGLVACDTVDGGTAVTIRCMGGR